MKVSYRLHWKSILGLTLYAFTLVISPTSIGSDTTAGEIDRPGLTEEEQHWLSEHHTVRVRVGEAPPYQIRHPVPQGLSIDLIEAIARQFGFKIVFVPKMTWAEALRDLTGPRTHIDMVLTMNRTAEREQQFAITDDYLTMPWVIYQRKDSGFVRGIGDLKNQTLVVERGYVMYNLLKRDYPNIRLQVVRSSEEALRALATGQADAYVGNLAISAYLIRSLGLNNLVVAAPTEYGDHTQAMAVRKDWQPLASIISKGLAAMPFAARNQLTQKWIQVEVHPKIDYSLVWQITLLSATLIIVFLFWNRKLAGEVRRRKSTESALDRKNQLMESIDFLQRQFINDHDPFKLYPAFLDKLLELSGSPYGLVAEVLHDKGIPYLKAYALSNLAWDEETAALYEKQQHQGFEFHNLGNLFGHVITAEEVVIANDPASDSRRGGFPSGHPPIESFLGLPVFYGRKLVGEVGLANRPGGYDQAFVDELAPVIKTLGQIIVGRWEAEGRRNAERKLKDLATTDSLTGISNRRHFDETFRGFFERASRFDENIVLLMFDVDHFKRINDSHGHKTGDRVLVQIVQQVQAVARNVDLLARWGGEEFMLVVLNAGIQEGRILAERIRQHIENHDFDCVPGVTLSFGISARGRNDSIDSMITRADQALYRAKNLGRNRIELESE